jgi:hypothetical protein
VHNIWTIRINTLPQFSERLSSPYRPSADFYLLKGACRNIITIECELVDRDSATSNVFYLFADNDVLTGRLARPVVVVDH